MFHGAFYVYSLNFCDLSTVGENTVSTLGRMVLIIWLFVVLIINSSYTASLTSILTVQQLYSPINGIESLKETDEPIGFQVGSFAERYLEETGIPKSRLVALGSPEEYATALQRGSSKGGVAAVVDERPYVELFLSNQCKFRIVGQEFTKSGWGFVSFSISTVFFFLLTFLILCAFSFSFINPNSVSTPSFKLYERGSVAFLSFWFGRMSYALRVAFICP